MKNRFFVILLISFVLTICVIIPGNRASANTPDTIITVNHKDKSDIQVSDDDFETVVYLSPTGNNTTAYIIVTNNSDKDVSIDAEGTAFDINDEMLAIADSSLPVIGPGETSIISLYFKEAVNVNKVDYTLSYKTPYFQSVLHDLEFEQILNDRNITITATNNGQFDADFLEAHAFYFDANNNLMRHTHSFIMDNDNMIKPGSQVSGHLNAPQGYDHAEVYYVCRSDGKSTAVSAGAIDSNNIEVNQYEYLNHGNTNYFLILTNKSDKDVKVIISGKAYDSSDLLIGTNDQDIPIIGVGETTIAHIYFKDVKDVARFDYDIETKETGYFSPVLKYLSLDVTDSGKNTIVSITNNGDMDADFPKAYILYFDKEGNVINTHNTFIMDDDSKIKPGNTERGQFTMKDSYDHYEIYLVARHQNF